MTKDKLDDCDDHEIYTFGGLKELLAQARRQGLYPGWNRNKDGSLMPRKKAASIMTEEGKVLNSTACKAAVTALGFQLEDNMTWLLPHFFCNHQVFICAHIQMCAQMCTLLVLS